MVLAPAESTDECVLWTPDRRPVMTRGGEERRGSGCMEGVAKLRFFSAVIRDRRCGDFGDDLSADHGKMADGCTRRESGHKWSCGNGAKKLR